MTTSMHRLQISLPRSQVEYLAERARREGTSIAELIRRLIHRESEKASKRSIESIWKIVGIGQGPERLIRDIPVSEAPDLYIAEESTSYCGAVLKKGGKSKRKGR
jgi:hypothetical protein